MDTLTLQCWIYSEDFDAIFPIKISRTENVGALKKAIWGEISTTSNGIQARALSLYSIPMPDDEDFEATLQRWTFEGKQRLNSRHKLSSLNLSGCLIVVHMPNIHSRAAELLAVVPDMTLNYWVRGDPISRAFSIEFSSTGTVGSLGEAIKNKRSVGFRDIDADDLVLYKVLLPYHDKDSLKGVLGTRTISSLGQPLLGSQKLSAIFMQLPPDDQLHLIIEGLVPLQCWIRGADPVNSFEVQISAKASIDHLKNLIKAMHCKVFGDLSPDRLKLYKIPADGDAELHESLSALGSGQLLQGNLFVEDVFDDVLFSQMPRVVVERFEEKCSVATVPSIVRSRMNFNQDWACKFQKSPSEQGEPQNFNILQSTACNIEWTRPCKNTPTIPVTLLHPIFGQFVDDCRTHEPTVDDNTLVLELSLRMSNIFEKESQRQEEFLNILRSQRIVIVPSIIRGFHTDGDAHVNNRRYLILEVKSEVGSKGAEPYCQAILYYLEGSRDQAVEDLQFNFPCLIITLFGPHLSFSGAVWTGRPSYQILSTVLPLFWHPTDTEMRQSAARHMGAFKKACQSLRQLYEQYDCGSADFKDLQPEFPHPRYYTSLDGKGLVRFRYIHTLEATKKLFVVETDTGERLCIKFARAYGRAVHQQCAAWEVSPSLRGLEAIPGGWHMVVMDLLVEYECLHDIKYNLSRKQKGWLRDELRRKLGDLHQMELVHGDVRDANVMVTKDRSEWMLVDFDWSGKIGEARYPMNVNRAVYLRRPEGALDGQLILADHDMAMLDYMFQ